MPKKPKYRLEPILTLKTKARKQAEINLSKAIRFLEEEKKKLDDFHLIKKGIIKRQEDVKTKMRQQLGSGQAKVGHSRHHFGFIDKLKEDESRIDEDIEDQKTMIESAERKVQRAKRDYINAANEVNMLEKHKELWQKQLAKKLSFEENKLMNELGNNVFQINRMKS